jgi:hypothetical protein
MAECEYCWKYFESPSIEQHSLAVILTIRVWAVWGRDRRLTIGLPIFFAMCFVPCIALMGIFLKSAKRESILLAHSFTLLNLNSHPGSVT